MKKIVITDWLGVYSLMVMGCSQPGPTISMMEEGGSVASTELSNTKSSYANHPDEDRFIANRMISYKIDNNDELKSYRSFEPTPGSGFDADLWKKKRTNQDKHKQVFNLFAKIIPKEFRKDIKYFGIIDPNENKVGNVPAYAAIGPNSTKSLECFCLDIAFDLKNYIHITHSSDNIRYNTLGYNVFIYTIIHEFGHYVTMNKAQQDLVDGCQIPKQNSILDKIIHTPAYDKIKQACSIDMKNITKDSCSEDEMLKRLKVANEKSSQCKKELVQKGEFVTGYATDSFHEDAAETFTHFVLTDECPKPGVNGAKDKILLFYEDPKMVQIREAIRDNLKNLAIHPNMSLDDFKQLSIYPHISDVN